MEYALVFAAIAVVSVPVALWLTDESSDEMANQANCVSMRPPPASCLRPAVTTSTVTIPPSVTSTTAGEPITTTTTLPIPPSSATWGSGIATRTSSTAWSIQAPITVQNSGAPVAGAVVQVRIQITAPAGPSFYQTCVTDGAGTCTINWAVPITNATQVQVSANQITATPPVTTLPGALVFTCLNNAPTSCL